MNVDTAQDGTPPTGFAVEIPGFDGPFRLLADLILDQKIDVCDVPIAKSRFFEPWVVVDRVRLGG